MTALQRKERQIIFSGSSVRGILDDRKWATRRELKPRALQLINWGAEAQECHYLPSDGPIHPNDASYYAQFCPYGQPGDRLWVREAWAADAQLDWVAPRELSPGEPIRYQADGALRQTGCAMITQGKKRPAMFMPRWASRILLEITDVRVERLQAISEEQALAEGVKGEPCDHARHACTDIGCWGDTAKGAFGFLWESIHGTGSWDANPLVWVVEFRRIQP